MGPIEFIRRELKCAYDEPGNMRCFDRENSNKCHPGSACPYVQVFGMDENGAAYCSEHVFGSEEHQTAACFLAAVYGVEP